MNYSLLRRELLQIMRGHRSQNFINRKLGFRFNQVYRWESGYTAISWTDFVRFASACRIDVGQALQKTFMFNGKSERYELLVKHLIGDASVTDMSSLLGKSRFTLSRWVNAKSEPTLEDIFALIHLQALLLGEFIEAMVPLDRFRNLDPVLKSRFLLKQLLYSDPRVGAVLRCFELKDYLQLTRHQEGFIAKKLGISIDHEQMLLQKMKNAGVIKRVNGKYEIQLRRFDTSGDFISNTKLKKYWTQVALNYLQRLERPPADSLFGYHVFSVSPKASKEIHKATGEFYARIKSLIGTDAEPAEEILVLNFQIFNPANVLENAPLDFKS